MSVPTIWSTSRRSSRQIATQMAHGALAATGEADVAVAITGHLGPDAPPQLDGLIWIGTAIRSAPPSHARAELVRLIAVERIARQAEAATQLLHHAATIARAHLSCDTLPCQPSVISRKFPHRTDRPDDVRRAGRLGIRRHVGGSRRRFRRLDLRPIARPPFVVSRSLLSAFVLFGQFGGFEFVFVGVVVARDVVRLIRAFQLGAVLLDHVLLNHLAALRVDRVGDIGVEFGTPLLIAHRAIVFEASAAVVAVAAAEVVFHAAAAGNAR